ncbi:hypothetical protein EJ08DRAFT_389795 [Tothia fuscella]|uniref:Uncharacterized protein n=1 Tax=Tothia fuscella TaxID=1048955 RepID=A0A9P4NZ25_9PEZI|nr:hypothetical protein EJ08DRAFT_389795 [Tothia fuscella]
MDGKVPSPRPFRKHDSGADLSYDDKSGVHISVQVTTSKKRKGDSELYHQHSMSSKKPGHIPTSKPTHSRIPFLLWPPQVRTTIYRHLLFSPLPITLPKLTTPYAFESQMSESEILIPKPIINLNILLTSRQTYREAISILYRENHFVIHLGHHQTRNWSRQWGRMLAHRGPDDVSVCGIFMVRAMRGIKFLVIQRCYPLKV